MNTIFFDIESNGLLYDATKVHVLSLGTNESSEVFTYYDEPSLSPGDKIGKIETGLDYLFTADRLVGHNIVGYDLPLLKKIYPEFKLKEGCVIIDTMLLSCIYDPDGAVSLEDWAKKLGGEVKVSHEDWSSLSENMIKRNRSDVRLTKSVYDFLMAQDIPMKSHDLEKRVLEIHTKQTQYGVLFDKEKAIFYYNSILMEMKSLEEKILLIAPMKCICSSDKEDSEGLTVDVEKPFLKSGAVNSNVIKYLGTEIYKTVRGPFCRVEFKKLDLHSSSQVKELLLTLGWKPTEYNFSKKTGAITSPKLTEDSYDSLPDGLGKEIAKYNTLSHRKNYLVNADGGGAIASVRDDGRVSADAMTCATNTARYRHSGTVCNIPKVSKDKESGELLYYTSGKQSVPYGTEIRSLFGVTPGSTMLGFDLAGIEARMLAHFCYKYKGGPEMADLILTGDFHQHNADAWGITRNLAKNSLYALVN